MSLVHARHRAAAGIPTSSMADIAFLLLVFFLVTTVFDEEKGLPIMLPQDTVDVAPDNVLHLVVRPDGRVELRRGESPATQVVGPADVAAIWRFEVARNPKLIAAVKTDASAEYGRMVDVLDALQAAGAARISLQVLEP